MSKDSKQRKGGGKNDDAWLEAELSKLSGPKDRQLLSSQTESNSSSKSKALIATTKKQSNEPQQNFNSSGMVSSGAPPVKIPSAATPNTANINPSIKTSQNGARGQTIPVAAHAAEKNINQTDSNNNNNHVRHASRQSESAYDEGGGYGEDFEDYDEDFEEFEGHSSDHESYNEPSNLNEVKRALQEENERASSRQNYASQNSLHDSNDSITSSESSQSRNNGKNNEPYTSSSSLPANKDINLIQPKKPVSVVYQKMMRRAKDLKDLVDFDVAIYDIFDLQPMNEYELYIRNYGARDAVQSSTQWNEESISCDIQTDDWIIENKWTQAPPDQLIDCGSGKPDLPWLKEEADAWEKAEKRNALLAKSSASTLDSLRLVKFLRKSSQVMDVLLEENTLGNSGYGNNEKPTIDISQGVSILNIPKFLKGRYVKSMQFSVMDNRLLLTAWSLPSEKYKDNNLSRKGILCLYQLTDPSTPYRILICEGEPTTCCVAPNKPNLVFAGTADGGVCVWDLLEPASIHSKIEVERSNGKIESYVLRRPSYCTDGIYDIEKLHREPIKEILPLFKFQGGEDGSVGTSTDENLTFQISSIDEGGNVQIWVVLEVSEANISRTLETDFGMMIGSKIKLLRSTGFTILNPDRYLLLPEDIRVLTAKFYPNSIDKFIVGADTGIILNESRFREKCHPYQFIPLTVKSGKSSDPVHAVSFNPYNHHIFLAGYKTGKIAMYHSSESSPIVEWNLDSGAQAIQIEWSPHRPSVFYVLDSLSRLCIWDLISHSAAPSYEIYIRDGKHVREISHFALSPSIASAVSTASQTNLAVTSRHATLALAFMDGSVEVNILNEDLGDMIVDEKKQFSNFVTSIRK